MDKTIRDNNNNLSSAGLLPGPSPALHQGHRRGVVAASAGVWHAPMQQLAQPLMTGPSRDLDGARSAYAAGDIEASRAAHANAVRPAGMKATEDHIEAGGRVKSIVFGGLDGILTSFAVVSGAVGAHLAPW